MQGIDDNTVPYNDAEAIKSVMDSESAMEGVKTGSVKDFWSKVHAATSYSLYCDYANGFQSRETYTKTSQMFDWYVPLRKFDEDTAEDVYGYVTEKGDPSGYIGSVVMGAKGRKSLSEVNVLAQIGAMGNMAISNGGKNAILMSTSSWLPLPTILPRSAISLRMLPKWEAFCILKQMQKMLRMVELFPKM